MANASWTRPAAPAAATRERLRVGVLLAPGAHNTPTGFILDPTAYDLELIFMLASFDYPHARIKASYDVLFNAIGDADRAAAALARADAFADAVGLPIANHPRLIADTGRDRMAARLASIDHCMVPPTVRRATASLRRRGAGAALTRTIGWPLLVRPVGSHGGTDLARLDSPRRRLARPLFPYRHGHGAGPPGRGGALSGRPRRLRRVGGHGGARRDRPARAARFLRPRLRDRSGRQAAGLRV
jgi:hypothetical protein